MKEGYVQLNLPSQCIPYAEKEISIRTLRGKDEKLIAGMTMDNIERKFVTVLRNVIDGIDPEKLTLGDRRYILVWLAMNSYSQFYNISFDCEHCLRRIKDYEIDMGLFKTNRLPDDFNPNYQVTIGTEENSETVTLRLLTVADEIKTAEYEKSGDDPWNFRTALSIVSNDNIMERIRKVEEMIGRDSAKIRGFQEQFDHGPVMEAEYECPKCGGKGVTPVPFRIDMVFPFGAAAKKHFRAAV